ncbi:Pericentrin [Halotydeus destructor]|nr:Pericentrin [Halotydeus destructor]
MEESVNMRQLEKLNSDYEQRLYGLKEELTAERDRVVKLKELVELLRLERLIAAETETINEEKIVELSSKLDEKAQEAKKLNQAYTQISQMYSKLIRDKTDVMTQSLDARSEHCEDNHESRMDVSECTESSFYDVMILDNKMKELNTVMESLITKNTELVNQLAESDHFRSSLEDANVMIEKLNQEADSMSKKNRLLVSQLEQQKSLQTAFDNGNSKIKELNKLIDALVKKNDSLYHQLEDNRNIKSAMDSANKKVEELSGAVDTLMKRNRSLQVHSDERKDLQIALETSNARVKELHKDNDMLLMNNEQLHEQTREYHGLKMALEAANSKLRELNAKIDSLADGNAKLKTELNAKNLLLKSLKKERTANNAKTVPLKENVDRKQNKDHLDRALQRCLHQKRELVFQKRYLLSVLGGFQLTEKATLSLLANMDVSFSDDTSQRAPSPRSRFRSAALSIIALRRMKQLVQKWGNVSQPRQNGYPSSMPETVIAKHQSTNYKAKPILTSLPEYNHHNNNNYEYNSPPSSTSSSSSSYSNMKSSQTNATLDEFVTRLQKLHNTLGKRAPIDVLDSPPNSLSISEDDL